MALYIALKGLRIAKKSKIIDDIFVRDLSWFNEKFRKGEELEAKYQEYIDKYNGAEYGYYQAEKEMKNYEEEMEKNMLIRDLINLILQS